MPGVTRQGRLRVVASYHASKDLTGNRGPILFDMFSLRAIMLCVSSTRVGYAKAIDLARTPPTTVRA